jgi:site-specific DNA-cytosine methylase
VRLLDLFSGLRGWSEPFAERGHEVLTLDFAPRFGADMTADILEVAATDFPWQPDVVLASPPCEAFSVLRIAWYEATSRRPGPGNPRMTEWKRQLREQLGTSDARQIAALRAKIPPALALDVCLAAERDFTSASALPPFGQLDLREALA